MIPNEAVVAAFEAWRDTPAGGDALMNTLEAAAPFLRAQAIEDAAESLDESADVAVRSWGGKQLSATASTSVNTTRHDARMLRARAVTERGQG